MLKLTGKVQGALVSVYLQEDEDLNWVFSACRIGMSKALGRPLRKGETFDFVVEMTEEKRLVGKAS